MNLSLTAQIIRDMDAAAGITGDQANGQRWVVRASGRVVMRPVRTLEWAADVERAGVDIRAN